MCGKTRRAYAYFACQPSLNHGKDAARRFPGHPSIILVREDALLDGIVSFLVERVLGPGRRSYLQSDVDAHSAKAQGDIVRQIEALQRSLTDIDTSTTKRPG